MSYRTQINDGLKAALLGKTSAGASVFTALDRPLHPTDLPAVLIYTMSARRVPENNGNALINRAVSVNIEAAIQSTPENALNAAEALADEIESLIEADPTLGLRVNDTVWQQTLTDVSAHGSVTLGVVLLEYEVSVYSPRLADGAFEPAPDGFEGAPPVVYSVPDTHGPGFPSPPSGNADTACGPDGCDMPSWGGEVVK